MVSIQGVPILRVTMVVVGVHYIMSFTISTISFTTFLS